MIIRPFTPQDGEQTYRLFHDTVHTVNCADYSPEQLNAWSDGKRYIAQWTHTFSGRTALVAVENGKIIGFGDITPHGYLDRLYVARGHTGRGVGTALCNVLEEPFRRVEVYSSITARPFFEGRGYAVVRENVAIRQGVRLKNYFMVKNR